jgi:hypothetical protein
MTDGPLAGFVSVPIDLNRFVNNKQAAYDVHIPYLMGGKDPKCGQGLIDYPRGIDCSGFARTLLMWAAHGLLNDMPDGSWAEDPWFVSAGFKAGDYNAYMANAMNNDGFLRIAIHRPGGRGGDPTGHVWILVNGHSVESYGGHGPGERPWNHQWFVDHVDHIFVVGPLQDPYTG